MPQDERVLPNSIPHDRTARRLPWAHLPVTVRAEVERRCGSPVVETESQDAGFTPGLASILTCADGSRHFLKAASVIAQRMFAESYREEARKVAALPPSVPAPRLLWHTEYDDWVLLGFEAFDGRNPTRPWTDADLRAALAMTEQSARALTPPPTDLELATFADDLAALAGYWDYLALARPDLPHLDEVRSLAASFAEVTAGDTVVHTDIRADNILIDQDGRAVLCDWNWPVVGAAWIDTAMLMIGPRGDGHDVEALLAAHPLTKDVPADHIDRLLALVLGHFWKCGDDPVPANSPFMREAQRWQGDVCWDWLAERRGWH